MHLLNFNVINILFRYINHVLLIYNHTNLCYLDKPFLGSLGGRDFNSLSASIGVRNSNSGGGSFGADFRSGLGNYLIFLFLYIGQMFKISLNASSHELPLLY
jgi:hypothetical protein